MDPPVFYQLIARTVKRIIDRNNTCRKPCRHRDDLKCGTRFICIVQTGIPPHLIEQILFFFFTHSISTDICIQCKRLVQVKFRHIDTGINFSVLRIHKQNWHAFCLLFFHDFFCCLLRIFLNTCIQTDPKIVSLLWFFSVFTDSVQFNPSGICRRQNLACFSFQDFIILHFQTDNTLIITAGKSQYPWCQTPKRIITFVVFIHFYPGKSGISDLITGLFLHICFDPLDGRNFFHPFAYSFFRYPQLFRKQVDDFFRIFYLTVYHRDRTYSFIRRKYFSGRIQDLSSCSFDVTLPLMQILRFFVIIIRAESHQIDQPSDESHCHRHAEQKNDPYFSFVKSIIFFIKYILFLHKKSPGQCHNNIWHIPGGYFCYFL